MYERLIREIKKVFYKTLGKTHLSFAQLEAVVMDIGRHLNNKLLTYVESDGGGEELLTPNSIMWGQQSHILEDSEEEEELAKFHRRLVKARQHAWTRLCKEYIHGLMESHRINQNTTPSPEVGEIVLIVGEEKNHRSWMKGKVLQIVREADGVARGVVLLHKGNRLERPIQAIFPLEIKSTEKETIVKKEEEPTKEPNREKRKAAADAQVKILN